MDAESLAALSQRDELFGFALALILAGALVPPSITLADQWVGGAMIWFGMILLVTRLAGALYNIFQTSADAGRLGYEDGNTEE